MPETQLSPETRLFLAEYGKLARISLDIFRVEDQYQTTSQRGSASPRRTLRILEPERFEREYFQHIYVERPDVSKVLRKKLEEPGQYNSICFIGPARSGKTSILRKLWNEAKVDEENLCIYIDTRRVLKENPGVPFLLALSRDVQSCYRSVLFDGDSVLPDNGRNALRSFQAFALANAGKGGMFRDLIEYRERILGVVAGTQSSSTSPTEDFLYKWIQDDGIFRPEARDILNKLSSMAKLRHYALAARNLWGKKLQILILDNVDQLIRKQQVDLFYEARDLHAQVNDIVRFCIAVRDESVRDWADSGLPEHNAPPHNTRIRIDMPRSKGVAEFPWCELATATPGELINIVNRRLDATKVVLDEERLFLLEKESADNSPRTKEQLQRYIALYKAAASPDHIEPLRKLSTRMLGAMNEDSLICLTNGSIQDFLVLHRDFLSRLAPLEAEVQQQGEKSLEPWAIKTLCYQYFRDSARDYQFGIPNLFRECRSWRREGEWVGCSLKYLLAATTWGSEKRTEKLSSRYPTLQAVFDRIRGLGFTEETVREELSSSLRNKIIVYRNPKLDRNKLFFDNQILVSLRGKTLISYTLPSFGYLYQCYREVANYGDSPIVHGMDVRLIASLIVDDLVLLAEMHLFELWRLFTESNSHEVSGFVTYYRQNFGRPSDFNPYRSERNSAPREKLLLFETIMKRILAYLENLKSEHPSVADAHTCFKRIFQAFNQGTQHIDRGEFPFQCRPNQRNFFSKRVATYVKELKNAVAA